MSSSIPGNKFVFLDIGGKRWPRARRLLVLLGILLFLGAVFFVQSLFIPPQLVLPLKLKKLKEQLKALQKQNPALGSTTSAANAEAVKAFYRSDLHKQRTDLLRNQLIPKAPRPARAAAQIRLGYFVGWDPNCFDSLTAHVDKLTHICPEWFSLGSAEGDFTAENNVALLQFMAANKQLILMPLMTNLVGDARQPEAVENLAHGPPENQQKFIDNLKQRLLDIHAGGVIIDWENLDAAYQDDISSLLGKVSDALNAAKLELWVQIPVGEERQAYDIDTLSEKVNRFVAVLHDQVSEDDPPGPVAAQKLVRWLAGCHCELRRPGPMGAGPGQLRLRLGRGIPPRTAVPVTAKRKRFPLPTP